MAKQTEPRRPIVVIVQHPKAAAYVVQLDSSNLKDVTRWIEDQKRMWPTTRYMPAFLQHSSIN